jgi:hypothetical protein
MVVSLLYPIQLLHISFYKLSWFLQLTTHVYNCARATLMMKEAQVQKDIASDVACEEP